MRKWSSKLRLTMTVAPVLVVLAVATAVLGKPHARDDAVVERPTVLTVQVATLQQRSWPRRIEANGSLQPWQEVIVSPETSGLRIAELAVDVGSTVRRGQLMARLADDAVRAEVQKQKAMVAQAEASLGKARADLRRASSLDVDGAVSPQRLDEYKATEASAAASLASARADLDSAQLRLAQTRIVAPDDGLVSSRSGVLGNVVSSGAELYRLVRQSRIEWQAEVDARQMAAIEPGQLARVALAGGSTVQGRVRLLGPGFSTSTGRGIVYVSLPAEPGVRAGVFASGSIELATVPASTLPHAAIVLRDGRSYVYVVDGEGKVARRAVETGRRQDAEVEIVSGLAQGERVVAAGGGFLSEGAAVTIATAPAQKVTP